jgi:hypothetical protein
VSAGRPDVPASSFSLSAGHAANILLAARPRFVILAMPRSGTAYAARYLTAIGVRCSHEGYFTPEGPRLFNRNRRFGAKGDVSWMGVPFAGRMKLPRLHQVRDPIAVIGSLYRLGFFEPSLRNRSRRYTEFAARHFAVGSRPLDNCIRWYLEWNRRCEEICDLRYRVEDMTSTIQDIVTLTGERALRTPPHLSKDVNRRTALVTDVPDSQLRDAILAHDRAGELRTMAARYGYAI